MLGGRILAEVGTAQVLVIVVIILRLRRMPSIFSYFFLTRLFQEYISYLPKPS